MSSGLHRENSIDESLLANHFAHRPDEYKLILPFTRDFTFNWGRSDSIYGTSISVFMAKPMPSMREAFGFRSEIAIFICKYPTLEPRALMAINEMMSRPPLSGRADPTTFFLISKQANTNEWLRDYFIDHPQSSVGVGFSFSDVELRGIEPLRIHNHLAENYFTRDLFDYRLPIDNNINFFGRDNTVNELKDYVKKSENFGLYGLRKTGKTSLLYKVIRDLEETKSAITFYYDCKSPEIRELTWRELLARITADLLEKAGQKHSSNIDGHPSVRFKDAVRRAGKSKKLCIIFDEIEYISPISELDKHWSEGFVPFWQTLWSAQSEIRRISYGICGVNPSLTEQDSFGSVQNPVFGIVQPRYIKGLAEPDLARMVRVFGSRMGMDFSPDAVSKIYKNFGGHPLLTRLACSQLHLELALGKVRRPVTVDGAYVDSRLAVMDSSVAPHCRHAVSEIERFYPDEYEMLGLLASQRDVDFYEMAKDTRLVDHIVSYGIVKAAPGRRAEFLIPAIRAYLKREVEARLKPSVQTLDDDGTSAQVLARRMLEVARETDQLQQLIKAGSKTWPYADRHIRFDALSKIGSVKNEAGLVHALTTLHQTFVEPIDKIKGSKYFFQDFRTQFPDLQSALARIRVYRNWLVHNELNLSVGKEFDSFVRIDFDDVNFTRRPKWQEEMLQITLDELYYGLLLEVDRNS